MTFAQLWVEANERRKEEEISIIFLDLKAAYDSVNREILIKKMKKFKTPSEIIETIKLIWKQAMING